MTDSSTAEQSARPKQPPRSRALAALAPQVAATIALAEAADAVADTVDARHAVVQAEAARRATYDEQYAACLALGLTPEQLAGIGCDTSHGAAATRQRSRRRARPAAGTGGSGTEAPQQHPGGPDGARPEQGERVAPSRAEVAAI
jgi:hypothetical protein